VSHASGPSRRPAGYTHLVDRYGLDVISNWHRSYVSAAGIHRVETVDDAVEETFTPGYWPGDSLGEQLEFALKYDGVNLSILAALFDGLQRRGTAELLAYIRSRPTGKYARRIWFLCEWMTGSRLPLDDLTRGNYTDLLEPEKYYTTHHPRKVRRQRVNDNLLGDAHFCPLVRRTEVLREFNDAGLADRCRQVVASYAPEQLKRAVQYLYTKETRSSFEIEHIQPSSTRVERFIGLLQLAHREDFCERDRLVALQNQIVEPRFRELEYRTVQNYVGQTAGWDRELVHYVCPTPEDVPHLMSGLISAHRRMEKGGTPPVVAAAAVAYGFVFIHPFEDGNGRIHRFLIHNILARRGFTPEGIVFPVSAAMLHDVHRYDASLEAFSRPLLRLVDYALDEDGRMTVAGQTARLYRYIDLTSQAEALCRFIERAIDTELVAELTFLARYDAAREAVRDVVDLPDRKLDLFIRLCMQNHGRLSQRKRRREFEFLSDDEVARIEAAIRSVYGYQ
jgi:hypothetical protein